jgi:hypothetical protein
MQKTTMTQRFKLLSLVGAMVVGFVCAASNSAGAAPARADAAANQLLIFVGGHDSVGSLLPLPLMPTPRFRATGNAPTKSRRGKSRHCCVATRVSGKTQQ